MRWRVLITNSIVLAGITWMVAVGVEKKASKLVPSLKAVPGVELTDIAGLEESASCSSSSSTISALVTAYLDRGQPGLATAVIEKAPAEVRGEPAIAQLHARALFQRGRAREALAVAKEASDACLPSSVGERRCPSWLVAKSIRQLAFFTEVVAAGIEDPYENPGATKAAYEKSGREVRLVAVR